MRIINLLAGTLITTSTLFSAHSADSVTKGKTNSTIIQNGDFELLGPTDSKQNPENMWNLKSKQFPISWYLHEKPNKSIYGEAEVKSDTPASGKNYLMIKGNCLCIKQPLNVKGRNTKKLFVSMEIRGTANACMRINCRGKNYGDIRLKARPDDWRTLSGVIETPDSSVKTLFIQCSSSKGYLEIDDIKVSVAENNVESSGSKDN